MTMRLARVMVAGLLTASPALAQTTNDPFPTPIATVGGLTVRVVEFASIPDVDGQAARMMLLIDEPGTRRLFVNKRDGTIRLLVADAGAP